MLQSTEVGFYNYNYYNYIQGITFSDSLQNTYQTLSVKWSSSFNHEYTVSFTYLSISEAFEPRLVLLSHISMTMLSVLSLDTPEGHVGMGPGLVRQKFPLDWLCIGAERVH